jgi:hypothetical protein
LCKSGEKNRDDRDSKSIVVILSSNLQNIITRVEMLLLNRVDAIYGPTKIIPLELWILVQIENIIYKFLRLVQARFIMSVDMQNDEIFRRTC